MVQRLLAPGGAEPCRGQPARYLQMPETLLNKLLMKPTISGPA
jgi:hypothetical protein